MPAFVIETAEKSQAKTERNIHASAVRPATITTPAFCGGHPAQLFAKRHSQPDRRNVRRNMRQEDLGYCHKDNQPDVLLSQGEGQQRDAKGDIYDPGCQRNPSAQG